MPWLFQITLLAILKFLVGPVQDNFRTQDILLVY